MLGPMPSGKGTAVKETDMFPIIWPTKHWPNNLTHAKSY